MYENDQQDATV